MVTKLDKQVWALSFRDVMRDPRGRDAFQKFLESEHSEENLIYYLKVEELDNIASPQEWVQQAYTIYK